MLSDIIKVPNFDSWTCQLFKQEQCPIHGKIIIKTDKVEAFGIGVITWGEDCIKFTIPSENIKMQALEFKNGINILSIKSEDYPAFVSFEFYPDYLCMKENTCLIKIDCARAKLGADFEFVMSDKFTEAKGRVIPLLFNNELFNMYFSEEIHENLT
ncbi:MAG: hypothetical protein WCR36_06335 [Bacteroidaceae bacterium]